MREGSSTRVRLIEVARDLFYRQGYHATGVAEILRAAQVNSGSLYHFFPRKEDLLMAVLEQYKEMLWPELLQPVFDQYSDPIGRVFGLLEGYRGALVSTECTYGCPIGNLALELSEASPEVRRLIAENFEGWRKAIAGCFAEARDRFVIPVDPEELAIFVLTTMEGGIMQSRAERSVRPFDTSVAMLRDYIDRLTARPDAGQDRNRDVNDAGAPS